MIVEAQKKQLGTILDSLCEELDISQSDYEDAKSKYDAVGDWLAKPESELAKYKPEIYPQGSIGLGTAIKPLGKDEFDVDLVCELQISRESHQTDVKNIVGRRLAQNEKYKKMLKEKNRCWRLNYAGKFHMDILPAIPDIQKGNSCLLVPDREMREWKASNPKGYVKWFESRMMIIFNELLEARAEVEDLPDNHSIKTPLQRAVQILKRHRDIAFKKDKDNAPLSIVITTLAAKAYNNEEDLFEALTNIINGIPKQIDYRDSYPVVLNPTNREENFAEKWLEYPNSYIEFKKWLKKIESDLDFILKQRNMKAINESISPVFGEKLAEKGMLRYAEKIDRQRRKGTLKMSKNSGILGITGITLSKNTFYGE